MIIDKDTLYRFLVALNEQYSTSVNYFTKHTCNELQLAQQKYEEYSDEIGFGVAIYRGRELSDTMFDETLPGYDFSIIKTSLRSGCQMMVKSNSNDEAMELDDPRFDKILNLWLDTTYDNNTLYPSDVLTIDDMTFTAHDVLGSIQVHAEPHRLGRMVINDITVNTNEHDIIRSEPKLTEEYCDKIEELNIAMKPYYFAWPATPEPKGDGFIEWDDIINSNVRSAISRSNAIYLCETLNASTIEEEHHTAIIDCFHNWCDEFGTILIIRVLSQNRITFTYTKTPLFKEVVDRCSSIVREIRGMS